VEELRAGHALLVTRHDDCFKGDTTMDPGIFVPLGCFAMVVVIVAIISMTKMRDREMDVHRYLHEQEMEHQRKMKELEIQLAEVRKS
jgi:hypothetical protein